MHTYIHIHKERERENEIRDLGDSKDAVRGYCLDIPRFDESLSNLKQTNIIRGTTHAIRIMNKPHP